MSNTPATQDPTSVPAIPDEAVDGLEDIEDSDLTMPWLRIDHKQGVFVDGQSNEEFPFFDAIILGVVKQRILWPPEPGESGEAPMCRAVDFKTGQPDLSKWLVNHNGVTAQDVSGFTIPQVQTGSLPCDDCRLKEWKTDPKLGKAPWCSEQYTMPLIRLGEDGKRMPGIVSFQRTGLAACRSYISGFRGSKRALYTAVTKITAVMQSRGTVSWVTPSFKLISETQPTEWAELSSMYAGIRGFLTTPRVERDDAPTGLTGESTTIDTNSTDATPQPVARATPGAPAAPQSSGGDYDDEEPF